MACLCFSFYSLKISYEERERNHVESVTYAVHKLRYADNA